MCRRFKAKDKQEKLTKAVVDYEDDWEAANDLRGIKDRIQAPEIIVTVDHETTTGCEMVMPVFWPMELWNADPEHEQVTKQKCYKRTYKGSVYWGVDRDPKFGAPFGNDENHRYGSSEGAEDE